MGKKLFSNEVMIGITAMVISLSTLIVFVYQTELIRKQQYKSVYPHLNIVHMNSYSADYEFTLRNQGLGPAFITSIEVKDSNGQQYESVRQYLRNKISKIDPISFTYSDISVGGLIEEKDKIILIELTDKSLTNDNIIAASRLRELLTDDSMSINITYESIYEESWTLASESEIPIKN